MDFSELPEEIQAFIGGDLKYFSCTIVSEVDDALLNAENFEDFKELVRSSFEQLRNEIRQVERVLGLPYATLIRGKIKDGRRPEVHHHLTCITTAEHIYYHDDEFCALTNYPRNTYFQTIIGRLKNCATDIEINDF